MHAIGQKIFNPSSYGSYKSLVLPKKIQDVAIAVIAVSVLYIFTRNYMQPLMGRVMSFFLTSEQRIQEWVDDSSIGATEKEERQKVQKKILAYFNSDNKIQLILTGMFHSLPDIFNDRRFKGLTVLRIEKCGALEALPDSIGSLSLFILSVRKCSSLKFLPNSIGRIWQLTSLEFKKCDALEALPDSIGSLPQLGTLDLRGTSSLKQLPDTITNLPAAAEIELFDSFTPELRAQVKKIREAQGYRGPQFVFSTDLSNNTGENRASNRAREIGES